MGVLVSLFLGLERLRASGSAAFGASSPGSSPGFSTASSTAASSADINISVNCPFDILYFAANPVTQVIGSGYCMYMISLNPVDTFNCLG